MGWNYIKSKKNKKNYLFEKINTDIPIYFIHSYYVDMQDKKYITSYINFGGKKVATSIQYENLYGVQFHPEITHTNNGEQIFKNFVFFICKVKKNGVFLLKNKD